MIFFYDFLPFSIFRIDSQFKIIFLQLEQKKSKKNLKTHFKILCFLNHWNKLFKDNSCTFLFNL